MIKLILKKIITRHFLGNPPVCDYHPIKAKRSLICYQSIPIGLWEGISFTPKQDFFDLNLK